MRGRVCSLLYPCAYSHAKHIVGAQKIFKWGKKGRKERWEREGNGGREGGCKEGRREGNPAYSLCFLKHYKLLNKSQCPTIKEIPK